MSQNTEIIVRGVELSSGSVLLVRKRGESHTFLPGGHVLFAESARSALEREIMEELGKPVVAGRLLGVVEHSWESVGSTHHELNLVFQMVVEGLETGCPPTSIEGHLEFLWQPLGELKVVNLQPHPLQELLRFWLTTEVEVGWGSSISNAGSGESRRG
jgi:8-oxo-dGTP pyrophosphatase MutT (NUDIX family)